MSESNDDDLIIEKYIYGYPLDFVRNKLREKRWLDEDIDRACTLYRYYILLRYRHPTVTFPPSFEIDQIWKIHTTHPSNYQRFCDTIFKGQCLDRDYDLDNPKKAKELALLFEKITQPLFLKELGIKLRMRNKRLSWESFRRAIKKTRKVLMTGSGSIAIILALIGGTWRLMFLHNKNVDRLYNLMDNRIRMIALDRGQFYELCRGAIIKDKKSTLYTKTMYELNWIFINHLNSLVDVVIDLRDKKLLTPTAHDAIAKFTFSMNILYKMGSHICDTNLPEVGEVDTERRMLVAKSQESRQRFLYHFIPG